MIKLTINEIAKRLGENVAIVEERESLLNDLCIGQEFLLDGIHFAILDKNYDEQNHILAISKNIYQHAPFSDQSNNLTQLPSGQNETAYEILRRFATKIQHGETNRTASKITSLMSDNGLSDYGEMVHTASMLTIKEFIQYRHAIPKIADDWWLATPHGTISSNSCESVCYVNTHGNIETARYDEELGVRPVILLNNTLPVISYETITASYIQQLK